MIRLVTNPLPKFAHMYTEIGLVLEEEIKRKLESAILIMNKYCVQLSENRRSESAKEAIQLDLADFLDEFLEIGNNTIMVLKLRIDDKSKIVMKLYNTNFVDIVMHYYSLQEFQDRINPDLQLSGFEFNITVSYIYLFGHFRAGDKVIPYTIQEYTEGMYFRDIKNNVPDFPYEVFNSLFKSISSEGIIIDPSPKNWVFERFPMYPNHILMTYIDLLYFNDPILRTEASKLTHALLERSKV